MELEPLFLKKKKNRKVEHCHVARIINLVISLTCQSTDSVRWPCALLNNRYIEIYLWEIFEPSTSAKILLLALADPHPPRPQTLTPQWAVSWWSMLYKAEKSVDLVRRQTWPTRPPILLSCCLQKHMQATEYSTSAVRKMVRAESLWTLNSEETRVYLCHSLLL
jgi:hypothetical protein